MYHRIVTRLLVLIAGTNNPSNGVLLASAFAEGARSAVNDLTIDTVKLAALKIDHFRLEFYDPACTQEEDFCALQHLVEQADGVVIATPVWNFSVPAHLKNFIDRMGSFALDATRSRGTLKGKPFFLIFTGGSPGAAWTGLMRKTVSFLPQAIKYFGGSVLGQHYEPRCMEGHGRFGLVVDKRPESLARMREEGTRFARSAAHYALDGSLPIRHGMMHKAYSLTQRLLAIIR
ncbi:TPA: hypothetical protein DCL30_04140 [Candidatus Peribacteria bacterium]|nr:hypothetical protein [Candidatus Peribacteria bacterium]HAS34408.1 hypothetical protein [Candidatus Peribacteria bacterium]